jgi:hypothetical protein
MSETKVWIKVLIWRDFVNQSIKTNNKKCNNNNNNNEDEDVFVTSQQFGADSTVAEVLGALVYSTILSGTALELWDSTCNPPTNITHYISDYSEKTGPKSLTLFAAKCFPSGTWMVLPPGMNPSNVLKREYVDYQYNIVSRFQPADETALAVRLTNSTANNDERRPLPSQIMGSVVQRFDHDLTSTKQKTTENVIKARSSASRSEKQQRGEERARKLEERIQKIEMSTDKNKGVSQQVRKMLVKSRAVGREDLKMQDRIYYECVLLNADSGTKKEFRFFSPQESFAKVAASFESTAKKSKEVLIKISEDEDGATIYKRIPASMRIYEAISNGYLTGDTTVDTLIIRFYNEEEGPTQSIKSERGDLSSDTEELHDDSTAEQSVRITTYIAQPVKTRKSDARIDNNEKETGVRMVEDMRLFLAVQALDDSKRSGQQQKKKSAAAEKVRVMRMKAKAKGDKKRVPRMEDRFFLEVISVPKKSGSEMATSQTHFFAKKDTFARILQILGVHPGEWKIFIPVCSDEKSNACFNVLDETGLSLGEAEKTDLLRCFGRILVAENVD